MTDSESDEAWLDDEGNPIDDSGSEERVVDLLENASDYNQDFSELCEMLKSMVQRLKTSVQSQSNRR